MFCEKCGSPVKETDKFCSVCGTPVGAQTPQPPKDTKGGKAVLISWIVGGAACLAFLMIVLLVNISVITNFIHRNFTSPQSYYQFVEKKAIKDMVSVGGDLYNLYWMEALNTYDKSVDGEIFLELGEDGRELLGLAGLAGVDLSWIESVTVSVNSNVKDNVIDMGGSLALNEDNMISSNMIMDCNGREVYFQIPELSEMYLGLDMEGVEEEIEKSLERWEAAERLADVMPEQAKVEKLLNKYMNIALRCVDDVSMDTKTLKVEGVEKKYTELTVTIDFDTMEDMMKAVLTEMKNDEEMEKIIRDVTETGSNEFSFDTLDPDEAYEEFQDGIQDLLDKLNDREEYFIDEDEVIVMKVYVDGRGNVKGRSIRWEHDSELTRIDLLTPQNGNNFGCELSVESAGKSMAITGSGKRSKGQVNGDFKVKYNGAALLDVSAKKLDIEKLKRGQLNGDLEIAVSSKIAMVMGSVPGLSMVEDMRFLIKSEVDNHSTKMKLSVAYDEQDMGTLTFDYKWKKGSKPRVPDGEDVVMVEDWDDLDTWAETIDWENLVSNLEKTDLPYASVKVIEEFGESMESGELSVRQLYYLLQMLGGYKHGYNYGGYGYGSYNLF